MRSLIFILACLIGGPILAVVGFQEKTKWEKLAKEGVVVPAVITGGETKTGKRGSKKYKLDVVYETKEGRKISKNFSVPASYKEQHVSGNTLTDHSAVIRYLPSDPEVAILDGAESDNSGMMLAGGGIAFLVGAGILVFRLNRRKKAAAA